jgi:serine/threonine protein kinase
VHPAAPHSNNSSGVFSGSGSVAGSNASSGGGGGIGIKWRKGRTIGRGAFGAVYLGLNDDTGALMAVKELPFSLSDKKEIRKMSAEINLMRCVVA